MITYHFHIKPLSFSPLFIVSQIRVCGKIYCKKKKKKKNVSINLFSLMCLCLTQINKDLFFHIRAFYEINNEDGRKFQIENFGNIIDKTKYVVSNLKYGIRFQHFYIIFSYFYLNIASLLLNPSMK